jgi:hypothetical protein
VSKTALNRPGKAAALAALATSLLLAGCAATTRSTTSLADSFSVGRNAQNEPCQANRVFESERLQSEFDVLYSINCRGVAASRQLAWISATQGAPVPPEGACGDASIVPLAGIGPVRARRCFDQTLGLTTVRIEFDRGSTQYRGSAVTGVAGPMELALRALAAGSAPAEDVSEIAQPSIALDRLAAAPDVPVPAAAGGRADPEVTLREGIALNRSGLFIEASRLLNDALSRLRADTPAAIRAEIALEAGLADSNIRFRQQAAEHFALAGRILGEEPNANTPFLQRKRTTYEALDALNRRDWDGALAALATTTSGFPLQDTALLAETNQARQGSRNAAAVVSGPAPEQLQQIVLDAQRSWATSVAELARGGEDSLAASLAALNAAASNVSIVLNSNYDPVAVLWLTAQIERQAGRIDSRHSQAGGGGASLQAAITKFDCALAALEGGRPQREADCAIALGDTARARLSRAGGRGVGPIVAETQIERASLLRRAGAEPSRVIEEYATAIASLAGAQRAGGVVPAGLEDYLALLVQQSETTGNPALAERFFHAMQASGEPATAKQLSQLQTVVTADGADAARLRDRAELRRAVTSLRYRIGSTADGGERAQLESERADKERQLLQVEEQLSANRRLGIVDDQPAKIAEIQAALAPNEVYWKLVELRSRLFGIVIGKQSARIYAVTEPARVVEQLTEAVRNSIRDDSAKIPIFNVSGSAALFQLVAGPAGADIARAGSIIVDPAGPLDKIPAAVLVTDLESANSYRATRRAAPNDYSKVLFLAARSSVQTALSPRSFVMSRRLPGSDAANPFIGLGEHSAAPLPQMASDAPITIGAGGCPIEYQELARIIASNKPISAERIDVAAQALGVPQAPRITGAEFTDAAVVSNPNLDQYRVLHFATHGLPESRFGCANVPPALITSIGGSGSDGFLSFDEIARLRLDANLVVLSACQTSAGVSGQLARQSGQEEGGKSLAGLVRAFLAANSRAVLATYWQVPAEEEADMLFREFYSRGRSASIAEALRAAQASMISKPSHSHPYFWGAYFVVGDGNKLMLGGGSGTAASR